MVRAVPMVIVVSAVYIYRVAVSTAYFLSNEVRKHMTMYNYKHRFDENYEALSSCSGGSTEFKVCHYIK